VARARRSPSDVGALKLTHPNICDKEVDILRRFGGESIPRLLAGPFDLPELGYPASCYVMELADETLAQHFEGDAIRPVPQVRWCSIADDDFYRQLYAWIPYERRERDALAVASAVLVALETASSHVHGDVCPSNVLLFSLGTVSLRAKLADWGNARAYLRGTVDYTLIGGKELWCPPRTRAHTLGQPGATFEPPTDKTDIYGLGALVCWMLTGTVPDQLVRWDVIKDIGSQKGLPMERVNRAWHEFLVATTRADRERRADHEQATRLLAEVRSRLRGDQPIVEPTHPIQPLPDPPSQELRQAVTSMPQSARLSPPEPRIPRTAWNLRNTIAALAIVMLTLVAYLVAPTIFGPLGTSDQAEHQLCDQPDLLCTAQVLEPLAAGTKLTWPDGLLPIVKAWHRGPFQRKEMKASGEWKDQHYIDVAVVRLGFENTTQEGRILPAAELGLIVAVDEGVQLPQGTLPAYVLGTSTPGKSLGWIPSMPSATLIGQQYSMLLPEVMLPPSTVVDYPFTALFDISALPEARIVGLGSRQLFQSADAPDTVILNSLRGANLWPTERAQTSDVFDGTSTSELVKGGCYIGLLDAGLDHLRVDCDQAHTMEVMETSPLPPEARGSDQKANEAAGVLCDSASRAEKQLDSSLNAKSQRKWSRDSGNFIVTCRVVSRNSVPLWFGPKTQAAIEASR
jgi:serine/threonine protein kinase